jgi:hypothetical protein
MLPKQFSTPTPASSARGKALLTASPYVPTTPPDGVAIAKEGVNIMSTVKQLKDIHGRMGNIQHTIAVFRTSLKVNHAASAQAILAQELVAKSVIETELSIDRFTALLAEAETKASPLKANLFGVAIDPAGFNLAPEKIPNYDSAELTMTDVQLKLEVWSLEDLEGQSLGELREIVKDLAKGFYLNNPNFIEYWGEQSKERQQRFGSTRHGAIFAS